ncbi:prenylcysteine oxidase-like isoform X2 [Acanthaster planci]|uniref:Prenylcysteine oxidase-like isoform X2 n=1 Tax=Acanthaster planci TaxID=133434 RepID=A0A8B8A305_ACAPL|nr:prenylcysteine oxidase-like isoform X2 [Acanthaster planci]
MSVVWYLWHGCSQDFGLFTVETVKLIPEALLKSTQAIWHRAKVSTVKNITKEGESKFEITAVIPGTNQISTAEYDMVIVATPLTPGVGSNIEFQDFKPSIGPFGGRYQHTVSTFVHGRPNPQAFGKKPDEFLPDVETTCNISLKIRTLAQNVPVNTTEGERKAEDTSAAVYKMFSGDLLSDEQIKTLFVSHDSKEVVDWLAYPHYTVDDNLPPFILSEGLFYINGIEWAASAMEMSVIGAKNVALLAGKHWQGNDSMQIHDEKQVRKGTVGRYEQVKSPKHSIILPGHIHVCVLQEMSQSLLIVTVQIKGTSFKNYLLCLSLTA